MEKPKQGVKIYLSSSALAELKKKAEASGFSGRGSLSRYVEKIANESVIFLDANSKALLNTVLPALGYKNKK